MKHKNYIKLLSLMMSLLIVINTTGLTLNSHYCNSTDTLKTTIIPIVELNCEHTNGQNSCGIVKSDTTSISHNCCKENQESPTPTDCCQDVLRYFKIIENFDLSKIKVFFNKFLTAIIRVLIFIEVTEKSPQSQTFYNQQSPPTSYGKERLIAFHQLKLNTHLL